MFDPSMIPVSTRKGKAPLLKKPEENKQFIRAVEELIDKGTIDSESTTIDEVIADTLAKKVRDFFDISANSRTTIEQNWLDALRQYKGVYDADTLMRMPEGRSRAFIRITRTKVRTVDSRLAELLFPANGDRNWSVEPTPVPYLGKEKMEQMRMMLQQQTGQQVSDEEVQLMITKVAKAQADKMSKAISDQLAEIKYTEIMREVMHSGNIYGTGVLKGPLVSVAENKQYEKVQHKDGTVDWRLAAHDVITPFVESIRIWDIYPDMEAVTLDECRYIIQRRRMDKHALIQLSKRSDFKGDTIREHLSQKPHGDYTKKSFETELYSIGDVIKSKDTEKASSKYEVLEFWGYVSTEDLREFGVKIPESIENQLDLVANVWVLGDKVIKAAMSPLEAVKWPFFFYYYDKDETSIFGEGIPSIMSDIQDLINSAFRAMVDNAAISAGPQLEVNLDLVSEDEMPTEFYPFKVWLRTGEGMDASNPAIRAITLPSYTPEFERMIELFRTYGDEITSIPRHMWGEPSGGAGRTAAGLSMLMGSANTSIKEQVKNFDGGITKPFITAMYYWNMQFGMKDDIKGDYAVLAKGTSSLIAKEVRAQSLISFAQMTANPLDAESVNRTSIIRAIADTLDLLDEGLVKTDEEIAAQQQAQQQAQEEERAWMTSMIEAAREEGVSPSALINSLRLLRKDMSATPEQQSGYVPQVQNPINTPEGL